jgi:hypothetical protein
MVFWPNPGVNRRDRLGGIPPAAPAQSLDFLHLGPKSAFLNWKRYQVSIFKKPLLDGNYLHFLERSNPIFDVKVKGLSPSFLNETGPDEITESKRFKSRINSTGVLNVIRKLDTALLNKNLIDYVLNQTIVERKWIPIPKIWQIQYGLSRTIKNQFSLFLPKRDMLFRDLAKGCRIHSAGP